VHPHRQTDDAVGQVVGVGGAHALPWGMPPLAGSRGAVYGGLIPVCGRVVVSKQVIKRTQSFTKCTQSFTERASKYPPAKPGALECWPLKAAGQVADATCGM
jgi:hypothetical protein